MGKSRRSTDSEHLLFDTGYGYPVSVTYRVEITFASTCTALRLNYPFRTNGTGKGVRTDR